MKKLVYTWNAALVESAVISKPGGAAGKEMTTYHTVAFKLMLVVLTHNFTPLQVRKISTLGSAFKKLRF